MASVWERSSTRRVSGHFIHDGSRRQDSFPSSQNEAALTKFRLNREDRFYEKKRYCTFYIWFNWGWIYGLGYSSLMQKLMSTLMQLRGKTIHKIRQQSFNGIRNLRGSTNLREGSRIWGSGFFHQLLAATLSTWALPSTTCCLPQVLFCSLWTVINFFF